MKRWIAFGFIAVAMASCGTYQVNSSDNEKAKIATVVDSWHLAAAKAEFDNYFSQMTADAVFIGTDPTENWQLQDFKTYSKPYFDKGKAWSFTTIQRNIYVSEDRTTAWFDELLDTQMKICRGSGLLKKEKGEWKIAHYVLSIAIPNEKMDEVILLKKKFDDEFIENAKRPSAK